MGTEHYSYTFLHNLMQHKSSSKQLGLVGLLHFSLLKYSLTHNRPIHTQANFVFLDCTISHFGLYKLHLGLHKLVGLRA